RAEGAVADAPQSTDVRRLLVANNGNAALLERLDHRQAARTGADHAYPGVRCSHERKCISPAPRNFGNDSSRPRSRPTGFRTCGMRSTTVTLHAWLLLRALCRWPFPRPWTRALRDFANIAGERE